MNISNELYDGIIDNFFPAIARLIKNCFIYLGMVLAPVIFLSAIIIIIILAFDIDQTFFTLWHILALAILPSIFIATVWFIIWHGMKIVKQKYIGNGVRSFWMAYSHIITVKNPDRAANEIWCEENCKNLWDIVHSTLNNVTPVSYYFFLKKQEAMLFKLSYKMN
jgi:hypothetical protein